jgi:hypothetical protein
MYNILLNLERVIQNAKFEKHELEQLPPNTTERIARKNVKSGT